MNYDAVPAELKQRDQWVTWRYEADAARPDKPKKVPYNPLNGRRAASNNAQTWAAFDVALAAAAERQHTGVGFVFSADDPYVGIDLDDCIEDGQIAPWAQAILDTMQSYSEVSPSGCGIKLIVEGELPAAVKTEHIEIYGKGRYFTITGQHVAGTPTSVRNVNGEIARLVEATRPAVELPEVTALETRPAAPEYLREWAERIIDDAVSRVALAPAGTLHNIRLDMARWAGGLVPHGLVNADALADRLYRARIPQANHRDELNTIFDGIRLGASAPLALPPEPPQPLFDSSGVAYCPVHRAPLPAAKNGNGYKCHQRDDTTATGWCDFWWKGADYVAPTPESGIPSWDRNGAAVGSTGSDPDLAALVSTPPAEALSGTSPTGSAAAVLAGGQAARFVLYSLDALRDLPPVTWLLEGEIPAQLFSVICGPSGAGKSLLALDYAIRIARRYADSAVVYVAAEGGSGYRTRVDAWLAHHRADAPPNLLFIIREVPLLDALAVATLVATIRPLRPIFVVFDTLARCMVGGDENSAKDMGLLVRGCDTVRQETGAAVAVVHHAGKSGSGYRGSSALYAAADNWIDVSNDDGLITVSGGKAKDWKPFDPRYLRMVAVDDSIVLVPSSQVSRQDIGLTDGQRKVLETLALEIFLDSGAKRAELVAATGILDATIYRVLSHLKRDGYISQSQRGDPYTITGLGLTTIKNYHRALRQQNAELAQLADNLHGLAASSTNELANLQHTPVGGAACKQGASTGESANNTETNPLAPIPENLRMTTRMMMLSDLPQNQATARERCELYGVDFDVALEWLRTNQGKS